MPDPFFSSRPALRWEARPLRRRRAGVPAERLRAGVPGAYLPPRRLDVEHQAQERVSDAVPACVRMALGAQGHEADLAWLRAALRADDPEGASVRRLRALRAFGIEVAFPPNLGLFREGTARLSRRLAPPGVALLYRWEEPWLRWVTAALRAGTPPLLFVDLGVLHRSWRGLCQRHAVLLSGGDGRQAWIHDPGCSAGPTRIGISTLLDALLPGAPPAALIRACAPLPGETP